MYSSDLQDIHRAVDADQHLELAGRHARVSTELAQGSKLVDMDDLGDLRKGAGVTYCNISPQFNIFLPYSCFSLH